MEADGALISSVGGFVQAVGPGDQEGLFDTRQTHVTSGRSRTTRDQTGPYSDEIFLVGVDGTLTTDMPSVSEAVYQGQALGYSYTPSSDKMYTTRSDIVLTARFADNDVFFTSKNGVIFHPENATASTNSLSLTGKLELDGGQFSGTIDGPGGPGTVGTVDGAFYGPGAIEAGGVFQYDYGTFAGASSFSTTSD